jgi:hypothetical protein
MNRFFISMFTFLTLTTAVAAMPRTLQPNQPYNLQQRHLAKSATDNMDDFAPKIPILIPKKLKCKKGWKLTQNKCRQNYR